MEAGIQHRAQPQSATSQVSDAIIGLLGGKDTRGCVLHEVQTVISIRLDPSAVTAGEYLL